MSKIILDVEFNEDFFDKALQAIEYESYDDWLKANHDELCEGIITAFLKNSKEAKRLRRLDKNVQKKIEELNNEVSRLAELGLPPDLLDKIELLEGLYD